MRGALGRGSAAGSASPRRSLGAAVPGLRGTRSAARKDDPHPPCPGGLSRGRGVRRRGRETAVVAWACHGRAGVELLERGDQVGEAAPFDILHRVVGDVVDHPHGVHRHDPRVLQQPGDLGLELKALEGPRVERGGQGQDLERDRAAQRDLLGLVNHPHAAAGDLADDPEVAEDLAPLRIARARHRLGAVDRDGPVERGQPLHGRQQLAQRAGPLGMRGHKVLDLDRFARQHPRGKLVDQLQKRGVGVAGLGRFGVGRPTLRAPLVGARRFLVGSPVSVHAGDISAVVRHGAHHRLDLSCEAKFQADAGPRRRRVGINPKSPRGSPALANGKAGRPPGEDSPFGRKQ